MPKGYPQPRPLCGWCGQRTKKASARYCSAEHFGLATRTRTTVQCELTGCGNLVDVTPSMRTGGHRRYCSREHADLAQRAESPPVLCARPDCGKLVSYVGARPRQFCSVRCARLQHPQQTCVVCGSSFAWRSGAHARNLYCAKPCQTLAQRRRTPRICRTCGAGFQVRPSKKQVYCSTACRPPSGSQVLPCQAPGCGNTRRVYLSALRKPGAGKYCSTACHTAGRAAPLHTVACAGCKTTFSARDGRQYCSLPCYRSTLRTRAACVICHKPRHGNPRFCSLSCAYKGRRRRSRDPRVDERYALIRAQHAAGKLPKEIAVALVAQRADGSWDRAYAMVREALRRDRRGGSKTRRSRRR